MHIEDIVWIGFAAGRLACQQSNLAMRGGVFGERSSITISPCCPRSRKYSAIAKPANGAIYCRPGELADPATTMIQRSGLPLVRIASMARRTLDVFCPTAT